VSAGALLLVPLAGGESHTPRESVDPGDVALAGGVLMGLLRGA
jgi:hypothetical protein